MGATGLEPDNAASIAAIVPYLPITGDTQLVAEVLLKSLEDTLQDREALDVYYKLHCALLGALEKMVDEEAVTELFMQHVPKVGRPFYPCCCALTLVVQACVRPSQHAE